MTWTTEMQNTAMTKTASTGLDAEMVGTGGATVT